MKLTDETITEEIDESIRWHLGDKWRNSEHQSERMAWESRRARLEALKREAAL